MRETASNAEAWKASVPMGMIEATMLATKMVILPGKVLEFEDL